MRHRRNKGRNDCMRHWKKSFVENLILYNIEQERNKSIQQPLMIWSPFFPWENQEWTNFDSRNNIFASFAHIHYLTSTIFLTYILF